MLNLQTCSASDVYDWSRSFYLQHVATKTSFEETSQKIVKAVFESFRQADASPQFALVRIFRLVEDESLPADLLQYADPEHKPYVALMGTYGVETEWQNRQLSKTHKLMSLGPERSPMMQAVYEQIGLDHKNPPSKEATPDQMLQQFSDGILAYFYVPKAADSPYVPGHDFVTKYGIHSVVGIGYPFLSGAFYFLLAFSRSEITRQSATAFAEITAPFSTLLALQENQPLWVSSQS